MFPVISLEQLNEGMKVGHFRIQTYFNLIFPCSYSCSYSLRVLGIRVLGWDGRVLTAWRPKDVIGRTTEACTSLFIPHVPRVRQVHHVQDLAPCGREISMVKCI